MNFLGGMLRKLEFGDLLLSLYIAVFLRQYSWAVGNPRVAWALTVAATVVLCLWYLRAKDVPEEGTSRLFWPLVALPLLLVYALRLAFPDLSFDVLNHRIIQSERALRGPLFLPGDFFPTIFPFNPSSDMLTGISRHLLGFRLGTIINYLALLWAGMILNKLLAPFLKRAGWCCLGILLVLFTEHILFEINTYMVDLLSLPLMLEATRLVLNYEESTNKSRDLICGALLVGSCVALKLTNVAIALPIALLFAFKFFRWMDRGSRVAQLAVIVSATAAFLLPLLPHAVYIYRQTGSPVFPLYNKIFHSPYWPNVDIYDGRWGPHSLWETLLWPFLTIREAGRLSELSLYSGRICFGFVAAIMCLLLPGVDRRLRFLASIVFLGSLLWSATSGYIRYALYLEVAGGVLIIYLSLLFHELVRSSRFVRALIAGLPILVLAAQCAFSYTYVRKTEWGGRPTYFDQPDAYRAELRKYLMHDHNLQKFLSPEESNSVKQLEAWIVSDVKTNGVEVLLRGDVPMIAVNNSEYFDMPRSRQKFATALRQIQGKRVYSLSMTEDLDSSLTYLRQRRLEIRKISPVVVQFFSDHTGLHMSLIEIVISDQSGPVQKPKDYPEVTRATGPLPDDAFNAGISVPTAPVTLRTGEKAMISVVLQNKSNTVWPARGQEDGKYFVTIADSWLDGRTEKLITNMDARSNLLVDLWPGNSQTIPLNVTAPLTPGEYVLEIDVVQEGVTWFKDKGSETLKIALQVE
jgi:hypothetical protein